MREVTINCPGPGIILASASGYCDWESIDEDLVRIWFYPHPTVSPTSSWETPDFHNLRLVSDYACADSSDQYTSWSITKTYTVGSAQNYTVSVCADKPYTSSKVTIGDVSLQLLFIPTGGTGSADPKIQFTGDSKVYESASYVSNSIDGTAPIKKDTEQTTNDTSRIKKLENEIEILKQKINMILEEKELNYQ